MASFSDCESFRGSIYKSSDSLGTVLRAFLSKLFRLQYAVISIIDTIMITVAATTKDNHILTEIVEGAFTNCTKKNW